MTVRTDHRIVACAGCARSAENNLAGGQIVKKDFLRGQTRVALIDEVVSVGADRCGSLADAGCRACDLRDGSCRQIIREEMAGPTGGRRIRTPECKYMTVGADRRLPDGPRGPDSGGRDRGDQISLLIVDAYGASAILNDDDAAISVDRRRASRRKLRRMLIVGVRRIVVVKKNERLRAVRTLINHVMAVRTDGRRGESETIARRRNRTRRVRLAVVEKDGAIRIIGHEPSVGAHDRIEVVPAA